MATPPFGAAIPAYTCDMFDSLFAEPTRGRIRVALPVPIDSLFDYAVPVNASPGPTLGCRVLVPFSGRRLTGVIVEDDISGSDNVATILETIDTTPVLSPDRIKILREAAAETLTPIGIAIATALPPGTSPRVCEVFALSTRGHSALEQRVAAPDVLPLLAALDTRPLSARALNKRLRTSESTIARLERDGLIMRKTSLAAPRARLRQERVVEMAAGVDLETVCKKDLARAPKQAELLRHIAKTGPIATATLRRDDHDPSAPLRGLVKRGLVRVETRAAPRDVLGPPVPRDENLPLTDEQRDALAPIAAAIQSRVSESFLLHGVTGSGKTEIYLRAVADALAAGRQALLLVPEITLTHQLVARLRARFGDNLAVLHSGLSPGERFEQWQRLHSGSTPIAVGARSALFAPLDDLGVIIVDEEHDSAYKNEEGFRYHARDLACRISATSGCPLILGSATPALETRHGADQGKLRRLTLSKRIGGRALPAVEIIDMAREHEMSARGRKSILSTALLRAMRETLEAQGQTILFLNRRGFSTQVYCFECGFAERCMHCDVALVYHAPEEQLRCHYCDYHKPPPQKCGGCGLPGSSLLGMGTQRLEEEVRTRFPEARIARLDRDTTRRRGATQAVLAGLHDREIDILIGTQMVAKGHDFPGVRLVGVVAADLGLHMPDFRAAERSFQLLTQVAGRAGRADEHGRVILQTFVPDHYAIRPVRKHDYETFYAQELEYRRELGYPPFGKITLLMVSSPDEAAARKAAEELARGVRPDVGTSTADRPREPVRSEDLERSTRFEVLGPAPAPLPRLRRQYRFQVLLKGTDTERIRHASEQLSAACLRLPNGVRATLDVAPVHML